MNILFELCNELYEDSWQSKNELEYYIKEVVDRHPGEIVSLVYNKDKDGIGRELFIEYDPVWYKEDVGICGSDTKIDDYCLGMYYGDNIVVDNLYFVHDITDGIADDIRRVWFQKGE